MKNCPGIGKGDHVIPGALLHCYGCWENAQLRAVLRKQTELMAGAEVKRDAAILAMHALRQRVGAVLLAPPTDVASFAAAVRHALVTQKEEEL
jgi:hypothetical protein